MRFPLSGIVTGFRIHKPTSKDSSDYGELDVVQVGTKDYRSSLTFVFVQDVNLLERLLREYSSGSLKWINAYVQEVPSGRDTAYLLQQIFGMSDPIPIDEGVQDDGRTVSDDAGLLVSE